jgi:hypothetical protein
MPLLDVSELLLDPDLGGEVLVVYRRTQNISAKGRVSAPPVLVAPAPVGNVQPLDAAPLVRGPDQQNLPKLLQVITNFRLRSASRDAGDTQEYQPDIVVWGGDQYVVNMVADWSRYGAGFVRAECSSIDPIDLGPQP